MRKNAFWSERLLVLEAIQGAFFTSAFCVCKNALFGGVSER